MRFHTVALRRFTVLVAATALTISSVILAVAYTEGIITSQRSQAIDFKLLLDNGTRASIRDFRGKAVILVFFATECDYCREEVPELFKVYNARAQQVSIVMVSTGLEGDTLNRLNAFRSQFDIPWPVALDQDEYYKKIGVNYVPYTLILDREGRPIYSHEGKVSGEELLNFLPD
jgi:peroxiredoxin